MLSTDVISEILEENEDSNIETEEDIKKAEEEITEGFNKSMKELSTIL